MTHEERVAKIRNEMAQTLLYGAVRLRIRSLVPFVVYHVLADWGSVNHSTLGAAYSNQDAAVQGRDELLAQQKATRDVCVSQDAMWQELCKECGQKATVPALKLEGIDPARWEMVSRRFPGYVPIFKRALESQNA